MFGCGVTRSGKRSRTQAPTTAQDTAATGIADALSADSARLPESLATESPVADSVPTTETTDNAATTIPADSVAPQTVPNDTAKQDTTTTAAIPEDIEYESDTTSTARPARPRIPEGAPDTAATADTSAIGPPTVVSQGEPAPGIFPPRRQRQRPGTALQPTDSTARTDSTQRPATTQSGAASDNGPKVIDFEADKLRSVKITADSTAEAWVGNAVFHHNGAVITCDSMIRYNDKRYDFFNRVVINKGTTYVYGDRLEYDGSINMATVYAPIIKMVDEDAVLYTYRFSFNTLDNIGRYGGGATMSQKDNQMESKRGYYFVDTREFVGVDSVQVRNPDYQLAGDSVSYNLDTEVAEFFTRSYIWNIKGEILSAESGRYNHAGTYYEFTRNSYIMTPIREIWADSLDYNSTTGDATAYRDIQFVDDEQHTMAFGDYGEYWGDLENGMMTLDPSLLSFDPEQPDTLYMRSDSMFMYTFDRSIEFRTTNREGVADKIPGSSFGEEEEMIETPVIATGDDITDIIDGMQLPDSLAAADSLSMPDSIAMDHDADITDGAHEAEEAAQPDGDTPEDDAKARKKREKEARKAAREELKAERKELKQKVLSGEYLKEMHEDHECEGEDCDHTAGSMTHDEIHKDTKETLAARQAQADSLAALRTEMPDSLLTPLPVDSLGRAIDEAGEPYPVDSLGNVLFTDSLGEQYPVDNYGRRMELDSLGRPLPPPVEKPQTREDSVQRVFYGYRNVRIFREDFQAVCDSLVGFSVDSTMHMYINPVMWSEGNQLLADVIDVYTRNEQLYKAEFYGSPFASSEVDTARYNQIKGKFMEAWFRDNQIYRHDVTGNAETYYYMQDEQTKDLMSFMVIESANMSFLFEDQQLNNIVWRDNPVYTIYPMDKIPAEQPQRFPDFKWEGERRPLSKYDILTRTIRPSQREEYLAMPQPLFPLTERILRHKESMIQRGIWRERNDTLSLEVQEYIRSLSNPHAEEQ